ncbi:MAG: 3-dehydroquinate synthase [Ornithinimicrobium sp.]
MTVRIPVGHSGAPDAYTVTVGEQALDDLGTHLLPGRRVLVVAQPGRQALADQVTELARVAGAEPLIAVIPDAEGAKEIGVVAELWEQMGQADFTRSDLVIALGGGAATDMAGFAAATWLRGIDVVHLPTSLLAIVDAAVGGKSGINTKQGKNLVGSFHTPSAVLCDPSWLAQMPQADYIAGLAEIIKCGFIADPVILDLIEADPLASTNPHADVALELIERAVRVKAEVVTADLKEASLREVLNYGHTLAHAIELCEDYLWRHGDAVAVGMIYAAELGHRAGRTPAQLVERTRSVVHQVGLPTRYRGADWTDLRAAMSRDKKARGSTLRFVVLDDLARPGRLVAPQESDLVAAYETLSR